METQLAKWGNSLAVRVPKALANQARLREGDKLTLTLDQDGSLRIHRATPKYTLSELVQGISEENRHGETDWGPAQGEETW